MRPQNTALLPSGDTTLEQENIDRPGDENDANGDSRGTPVYSPNNPPWNSITALVFWLLSVLLIAVVPLLFLIPYLNARGARVIGNKEFEKVVLGDRNAVLVALGGTLIAHLITILVAWAIVTRWNRLGFRKMLGWQWGGFKAWHGLLIFVGIYAAALALATLLGSHENEMVRILKSSRSAVFAVGFIATFTAPLVEEVVYRGILYSAFQRTFNVPAAVIAVTVVFALVHVSQYYPDAATIVTILILSLVLTMIRVKTDNLLPCVVFHTFFNGVQIVIMILSPYLPQSLDPTKVKGLLF